MPRRATRQQRQQRSAEAEEVESAKPHMQPTKGGRARRAPWPLGSSSGGRRPLCVFRVRNPNLSEAERVQFFSEATKSRTPSAPRLVHEERQHNQAQGFYGRLHTHNHNNHHHRLETDLTRNAHGRHRALD